METAIAKTASDVLSQLGFVKLSQGVSLYTPSYEFEKDAVRLEPTLIVICSWAFAQPKHIAKYIRPYQSLYPLASILLVQSAIGNSLWRPDRCQMRFFQPAAAAIQAHISATGLPRILVHAFSNGGSHAAVQLSEACRVTCGGMKMPVDALILDSCPGQPRFTPTINALVLGIPSRNPIVRGVGTVLAYASVSGTALFDMLHLAEPAAWKLYRKLNDPSDSFLLKHLPGEKSVVRAVPRTYVCSKTDAMILYDDVLEHAQVASEKLFSTGFEEVEITGVVRLVEFEGTAHVNHIKGDPERYWTIIKDTWTAATH